MQQQDEMHPDDRRNLVIFFALAFLSYLAYKHYYLDPHLAQMQKAQAYVAAHPLTPADAAAYQPRPREEALAASPRLRIDNGTVFGSLSLKGARLDDLSLQRYYETLAHTDHVVLLSPAGTEHPEYVESGWVSSDASLKLPDADTLWTADAQTLGPRGTATLTWDNGQGLSFTRKLSIDADYMIQETDAVANHTGHPVSLSHYSLISEHGLPADLTSKTDRTRSGRVYEGFLARLDGRLYGPALFHGNGYITMIKNPMQQVAASDGWVGLSQKYWFTGLIPQGQSDKTYRFIYIPSPDPETGDKVRDALRRPDKFQVDVTDASQTIASGASLENKANIFAGAKEFGLLQRYSRALPGSHLNLVIDWGLYWFLTMPFFYVLNFFGHLFGNLGVAIICLTILTRAAVFPLANASFKSFAKMKKIQPQLKELREQYGSDAGKLQAALVALYEKENVNPMAGCLPIVMQIPLFFALYKVLSVTIEMRQAPFFGWIHDLSVQDPTTAFNLFGLIPWTPPVFLPMLGGWSCLMLVAMLLQQRLSPTPQDPSQQMVQSIMPFFVTLAMSYSPAGLVIYWTFSNSFSIFQQWIILRSMGVEAKIFHSREEKEMAKMVRKGPKIHPELAVVEDEVGKALTGEETPKPVTAPKGRRKGKR